MKRISSSLRFMNFVSSTRILLILLLLLFLLSICNNSSSNSVYIEAFTAVAPTTRTWTISYKNHQHNGIIIYNNNHDSSSFITKQVKSQQKQKQGSQHGRNSNNNNNKNKLQLQMIPYSDIVTTSLSTGSSSIITSVVNVFDGSDLVNVVVVSNIFWTSLISKIISLIIGQLIASIIFGSIVIFASKQVASFIDTITELLLSRSINTRSDTILDSKTQSSSSSVEGKYYVRPDIPKLLICILIDMIGSSSIIVPLIGDIFDVVWAPIAGIIVRNLFYGNNILLSLEIIEEILPITDILPLATICWIIDTIFWDTEIAKLFQLGRYKPIQYL